MRIRSSCCAVALALACATSGHLVAQSGGLSCHVTDGQFGNCSDGGSEWANVTPQFFSQTHAYLYAAQADLDPVLATPNSNVEPALRPVADLLQLFDGGGQPADPTGPGLSEPVHTVPRSPRPVVRVFRRAG